MTQPRYFLCICCLTRSMRARPDKRGRLYLGCDACTTKLFLRAGGPIGLFSVTSTLRLLDQDENLSWVRTEAHTKAASYDTSVIDLLTGGTETRSDGIPQLSPAVAAVIAEQQEAG